MMLAWPGLSILLTLGLTLVDRKDADEIHWAESYDSAFAEANDRGVPVVLIVIQDGEEANEDVWANYLQEKSFVEACQYTVNVLGNRGKEETHGTRKEVIDGEERVVCEKFGGGIRCLTHNKMEVGIFRDFGRGGVIRTPQVIVALPDQSIVAELVDRNPLTEYVGAVETARKKLKSGLSWREARDLKHQLAQADKWIEAGDLRSVIDFTLPLRDRNTEAGLVQRALLVLDRVEELGEARLTAVQTLVENEEYTRAVAELEDLRETFRSTRVEKPARMSLARLLKNRDVKAALNKERREQKAEELLTKGDELRDAGKTDDAQRLYDQVLSKFADTEAANRLRQRGNG